MRSLKPVMSAKTAGMENMQFSHERPLSIATTKTVRESMAEARCMQIITDKDIENIEERIRNEIHKEMERLWSNQITRVITIKEREYEKCKKEISDLIDSKKSGITTMEIIEKLEIDPEVVLKVLSQLKEEDKIEKIDDGN